MSVKLIHVRTEFFNGEIKVKLIIAQPVMYADSNGACRAGSYFVF